MRRRTFVITLIGISFLVACQQDRQVPKNTPRAVLGTPASNEGKFGASPSSPSAGTSSENLPDDARVTTSSSNRDVERKRFENTIQVNAPESKSNRTQKADTLDLDLSKLQSTRERNRKIMRKLEKSENEWPDKFDDQALGRLEKHMQNQGWSNFEIDDDSEDQASSNGSR